MEIRSNGFSRASREDSRELVSPLNSSRTMARRGDCVGKVHPGWLKPIETIGDQCLVIPLGNGEGWKDGGEGAKSRSLIPQHAANNPPQGVASTEINLRRMWPPRDREIKAAGFNGGLSITFVLVSFGREVRRIQRAITQLS